MNAMEIGQDLVALCNADREQAVMDKYYDQNIVSIEGQGSDEMPARLEGLAGVQAKWKWWYDNHEVHGVKAQGPFVGAAENQFIVRFELDVTPKGAARNQMDEVALYTVRDSKIVEEAFYYNVG